MRTTTTTIGLTVLRVALGAVFIAHGAQKFQQGIGGVAEGFAGMGIPLADVAAPLVASLELVGGALLVLGVATRVVGVLLAVDMLVALATAHLAAGFFSQDGGFEYVLVLAAGSVAVALTGPGRASLDALLLRVSRRRRGVQEPLPA
jgi:putative oxidoreductase